MKMNSFEKMLTRHEGFRAFPYEDTVGKMTVGYGRNLDDVGINEEEAIYLLRNDVKIARDSLVKFEWFNALSDVRKDVLVNMTFNIGLPSLLKFKKFITYLENKEFLHASKEMLRSKWASQVGKRALELSKMIETDKYPS